jgi:hypothetical protein
LIEKMDEVVQSSFDATFNASRQSNARAKSARSRKHSPDLLPVTEMHSESEGQFWFEKSHNIMVDGRRQHKGITTRERQQLIELVKSNVFTEEVLRNTVIQLNDENSDAPRLRAYDWAVTNYAKGHPKVLLVQGADGTTAVMDPNMSYEGELRKHHRLLFDPFRRGTHIFFEIDGLIHRSTVGQLTFIKWCIENGVDKYVEENLIMIRRHMSQATKRSKGDGKRRRRELTRAPTSLVRGVLMSSFEIMTDTPTELAASEASNRHAQAEKLAQELAVEEDEEKALEKSKMLANLL